MLKHSLHINPDSSLRFAAFRMTAGQAELCRPEKERQRISFFLCVQQTATAVLKALGIGVMVYHFFKNSTPKRFSLDNFQRKTFEATAKWLAWSQIFDLLLGGVNPHRDSLCLCKLKAWPAGME
ncbi:MAG: hypothetical protein JXR70_09225 [Spirochaetales bacterium]|nr:hypothetical protein [Spirochaetales bacterium]